MCNQIVHVLLFVRSDCVCGFIFVSNLSMSFIHLFIYSFLRGGVCTWRGNQSVHVGVFTFAFFVVVCL